MLSPSKGLKTPRFGKTELKRPKLARQTETLEPGARQLVFEVGHKAYAAALFHTVQGFR